jgi:hypothetical protein
MSDATLTLPGLLFIGAEAPGKGAAIVQLGAAAGWTTPRGINSWSRELSVVLKPDLTAELQKELGVVLPEQQGDPELVPKARLAAQACKVVAVEGPIVDQLLAKGVRVHTVGFDRVSNGFFYFAKGGGGSERRVQGELIEIISPTLEAGSREELDARLDGLIDRLIAELSEGALSEAQLELADALPPLGPKSDKAGVTLQTLEGWLILAGTRSAKYEAEGRRLAEALRGATRRQTDVVQVDPFGEARRVPQPELEVEVADGEAGQRSRLTLPARTRWFITGGATPSMVPPPSKARETVTRPETGARPAAARPAAAAPAAQTSASDAAARAVADNKAAAERAAAEKAAREKAAAEKAAAERAAAERAARDRAAAERAAAEKAAAERAAAERAAAERASAERAAAERASAERAAADKAASDRAAERAAAQAAAAESAEAEKAAARRSSPDARSAGDNADRVAAVRRSVPDSTATKPGVGPESARSAARESRANLARQKEPFPIGFIFLMLVVGAVIGAALRFVGR